MAGGRVDRGVLSSNYQQPGDTYDDKKTEAAFEVLAQQIDENAAIFETGGSALIVSDTIPSVTGVNVYAQLSDLGSKIQSLQNGVVPSGTITNAMLSGGITEDKLSFTVATQSELDTALSTKANLVNGKVAPEEMPPGVWEKLSDITLAADQAANTMLTFTGLSGYRAIKIVFSARSAGTTDHLLLRFNNDSVAKYSQNTLTNNAAANTINLTSIPLNSASCANANVHSQGYVDIVNEVTKAKSLTAFYAIGGTNAGFAVSMYKVHGLYYETLSAIDSLSLFTATVAIQAGSRFTVYGLK